MEVEVGRVLSVPGSIGCPSGWCMAGQHDVCPRLTCTCTRCPPEVHHSRAGLAPRIERIGDPMPWGTRVAELMLEDPGQ